MKLRNLSQFLSDNLPVPSLFAKVAVNIWNIRMLATMSHAVFLLQISNFRTRYDKLSALVA